jgi:hypothetical protein
VGPAKQKGARQAARPGPISMTVLSPKSPAVVAMRAGKGSNRTGSAGPRMTGGQVVAGDHLAQGRKIGRRRGTVIGRARLAVI